MAGEIGPVHIQGDRLAELLAADLAAELLGSGHLPAVHRRYDVALLQIGFGGGPPGHDAAVPRRRRPRL